jgi:hypothetical protein
LGALTLKPFSHITRDWDLKYCYSVDLTDNYGTATKIYINNNKVVQIEPDLDESNQNLWITDKGRQYFDAFRSNTDDVNNVKNSIDNIVFNLYISDICKTKYKIENFFTIIFENLSIELLSLITMFSQKNLCIKTRKSEDFKVNNDVESNFQLNYFNDSKTKLDASNLGLLISNNPRYEGYYLNLNLRHKILKKNFKCFVLGSLLDLTFSISYLGSNMQVLKKIFKGLIFKCQEFKKSKNPIIIYNFELLKRNDGKNIVTILKCLNYANILNKSWNGYNNLSPSLTEVGTQNINNFLPLTEKDFTNFSCLYFINVFVSNTTLFKKIIELKLLKYSESCHKKFNLINYFFIDQCNIQSSYPNYKKLLKLVNNISYFGLTANLFYDNEETFINAEGFLKRTNKTVFEKKAKDSWQLLRRVFSFLKIKLNFINQKENELIYFFQKNISDFKNYIYFFYQTTQILTNLNSYLTTKNQSFFLYLKIRNIKQMQKKLKTTKLKYWLDDFFTGGKDGYSSVSKELSNFSRMIRSQTCNHSIKT